MVYTVNHVTRRGVRSWMIRVNDGGKIRRIHVHPETLEPFGTKADARRYIEEMRGAHTSSAGARVEELARYMFSPDGEWAQRQARRRDGRILAPHTIAEHELNARKHIIPTIGQQTIRDVDTQMIDRMLYSLDLSNRARRNVAGTLRAILKEAVYRRIISAVPPIELPEKKSRKPSVLTLEELRALFPKGRQELIEIWEGSEAKSERAGCALVLAACSAVMFFGGLRPQEARAVHLDQLIRQLSVLLVTRSMNGQGEVNEYAKMGDERDPRYRGTFLVDRAAEILDELGATPGPFLFAYRGRPIRPELLHARLQSAASNAKILPQGRRLVPYSGRYTFDTTVRPILPLEILMLLMGHVDQAMPERYDVPVLLERMKQLAPHREAINRAIG